MKWYSLLTYFSYILAVLVFFGMGQYIGGGIFLAVPAMLMVPFVGSIIGFFMERRVNSNKREAKINLIINVILLVGAIGFSLFALSSFSIPMI